MVNNIDLLCDYRSLTSTVKFVDQNNRHETGLTLKPKY